jgi:hypothetical protein
MRPLSQQIGEILCGGSQAQFLDPLLDRRAIRLARIAAPPGANLSYTIRDTQHRGEGALKHFRPSSHI